MWRNSPTLTMSAASASGATGAISAALMPLGTTRTTPRGAPTMASIGVAGECAFEQEQFGAAAQKALDRAIDQCRAACGGRNAASRRAACRPGSRSGADISRTKAPPLAPWPCSTSGSSAGEMARHAGRSRACRVGPSSRCIANARNAELHLRRDGRQRRLGARAAGRAVADDADLMPARGLAARDIEDVTENAADRRAGDVHDLEGLADRAWSEPAFGDFDGVAGAERIAQRQRDAGRQRPAPCG